MPTEQYEIHWKDYYAILQVHPRAEPEVIEAAFRRLAQMYHPDQNRNPEATQRFQDINEANEVLSDSARRATYDKVYWAKQAPPNQQGADSTSSTTEQTYAGPGATRGAGGGTRYQAPPQPQSTSTGYSSSTTSSNYSSASTFSWMTSTTTGMLILLHMALGFLLLTILPTPLLTIGNVWHLINDPEFTSSGPGWAKSLDWLGIGPTLWILASPVLLTAAYRIWNFIRSEPGSNRAYQLLWLLIYQIVAIIIGAIVHENMDNSHEAHANLLIIGLLSPAAIASLLTILIGYPISLRKVLRDKRGELAHFHS